MEKTASPSYPSPVESDLYHWMFEEDEITTGVKVEVAVIILITTIGLVGNGLVIFVITSLKEYKRVVTHWYVLQLAIADTIFLCTLPFKVSEFLNKSWLFSSAACSLKEVLLFWNYYASVIFLVVMSIDRYNIICRQQGTVVARSLPTAIIISAIVWISSLIFCIPVMKYSGKFGIEPYCHCGYAFPPKSMSKEERCRDEGFTTQSDLELCISIVPDANEEPSCKALDMVVPESYDDIYFNNKDDGLKEIKDIIEKTLNITYGNYNWYDFEFDEEETIGAACSYFDKGVLWHVLIIFNFVVMFLIPFLIMTICYGLISFKIHHEGRDASLRDGNRKVLLENKRITVMCAALVFVFTICWLPYHVVHIAKINGIYLDIKHEHWCTILPAISSAIAYSNSALNPYLYNFLGTRFGTRLRKAALTTFQLQVFLKQASKSVTSVGTKSNDTLSIR